MTDQMKCDLILDQIADLCLRVSDMESELHRIRLLIENLSNMTTDTSADSSDSNASSMKFRCRDAPLESLESICARNGIHFDKSKQHRPIKVICEDGSSFLLDHNYNPFDKVEELYTGIVLNRCDD